MKFKNKEEFLQQLREDNACDEGFEWAKGQKTLDDIFKNCPNKAWLYWALNGGYEQFFVNKKTEKFTICGWIRLLQKHPQFAEHCDWEKLDGYDWIRLLQKHPQFAEHCEWTKLNDDDWSLLLEAQPQFKKYRQQTKV